MTSSCSGCGAELRPGVRFCPRCGDPVEPDVPGSGSSTAPAGAVDVTEPVRHLGPPEVAPPRVAPPRVVPPPPVGAPVAGGTNGLAVAGGTNGLAVASMVLGITSWVTCALCAPLAIIFGHVSRAKIRRIRRSGGMQAGSGMATAGLVLGYLAVVLIAGAAGVYWYLLAQAGDTDNWYDSSSYSSYGPSDYGDLDSGYLSTTTTSYRSTTTSHPTTTTTSRPTTTTVAPAPSSTSYDLGLSQLIANVGCNHEYVTMVGASIQPASYGRDIQRILDSVPGSRYLHTGSSCATFDRSSKDGTDIYAAYLGPYNTAAEACSQRHRGPEDSYVRHLNGVQSDPPVAC